MATDKGPTITLKLLVDARKRTVLFAEAGKDFIDFMFSLLTLPVGSVIKLLSPRSMTGCISKLYQSVEKLNETYILPNRNKSALLQPKLSPTDGISPLLLGSAAVDDASAVVYYRCGRCNNNVTTVRNTICPSCGSGMTNEMGFVVPAVSTASGNGQGGGFVKDVVTYMVTDGLEVTPMSAISSITLINKYGVKKEAVELEEKMSFGTKEGIVLLKSPLCSKTVLTDVFFAKASTVHKSPSSSV